MQRICTRISLFLSRMARDLLPTFIPWQHKILKSYNRTNEREAALPNYCREVGSYANIAIYRQSDTVSTVACMYIHTAATTFRVK